MSPLTKRRLQAFCAQKRAYYSFWLLVGVCALVMCANVICNKVPYVVWYEGKLYVPLLHSYPESVFGGDLDIEADFRDPVLKASIANKGGWMIWPPVPYDAASVNHNQQAPAPPSTANWLGTDDQGRDILARLFYGLRTSLLFGFFLAGASLVLGVLMGAVQGYFGGLIDLCGQRFLEIWSSLPILFILIVLSSFVEPSLGWLLGIMLLFSWMGLSGLVRAEFLRARTYDYVKAAQLLGISTPQLMWRHMLPNTMIATLTYLPFLVNYGITVLTSLDFLGFGLPLGTASLGELLTQAKNNLYAPWIGLVAFCSISFLLTLIAFVGEGLRDAFDAHTKI
ncbi:MAG: ABC transporter permease [Holosporaceae bacterium]